MTKWRLDMGQIEVVDDDMAAMLREKTPAERVEMISASYRTARLMLRAAIKRLHPDWNEPAIARETARRLRGTN